MGDKGREWGRKGNSSLSHERNCVVHKHKCLSREALVQCSLIKIHTCRFGFDSKVPDCLLVECH